MSTHLKSILYVAVLLSLMGCYMIKKQNPALWRQPFPDADIVYQIGTREQSQLGFINADGTNQVALKMGDFLRRPTWSQDGSLIYGLATWSRAYTEGYPAYWSKNGEFKECRNQTWFSIGQIEWAGIENNPQEVLISDPEKILLVDLAKCEEIKTIVDFSEHSEFVLEGFSYSPATEVLLYGLSTSDSANNNQYQIMKMDLRTDKVVILVSNALSPSWSPDSSQIAYEQADGIYLMKADGTQRHRLVEHDFINQGRVFGSTNPILSWSRNGQWVIYDRCDVSFCTHDQETIYKIDVLNSQENRIVDRGAYPSWRP